MVVSITLGFITAIVDFFVHPGMFGAVATEIIVTGIGAAMLSYGIGILIVRFKLRKKQLLVQLQ